jgi:hypothetical protein
MPEFLGDILVVTKDELIPKFWGNYNALKIELHRYKDKPYGIKRAMLGGNGRRLLVVYDSLPKRVQEKINDPRKPDHILQKYYKVDSAAVEFYNEYQYPDGSYLLPDTIEKLIINASVLKAIIKLETAREQERISKGGSLRGISNTLYSDAHSFNATLLKIEEVQHTLNSNLRRFKEQLKAFKTEYTKEPKLGYKSLIRDADGKSKRNALKIKKHTAELLNNLFAGRDYKPNATEVARQYEAFLSGYIEIINEKTGELYDPKDFKPLKSGAIKNYLRSYESKIGTHAKRSGDRQKLMQDFIPYESMDRPVLAGSIISIDDRQPPFEYEKGKRMWWYIGIDIASEAIVAWAYGKTKEELILNFYRNLVINHHNWGVNLPIELECESSLNSSFKNTFLKNGAMFDKVNIHANSARSKMIERFFRDMRYEFEKDQIGWLARPFSRSESNQAGPQQKITVPYKKLVEQCFANIIEWNNRPKKGTTTSRFDYFKANQNPIAKNTNYKSFIKHLGRKTATSCKAGIMHLQKSEWLLGDHNEIYTGEKLITLLKQVEGQTIDICWMDDEKGKVLKALIYDRQDGRYICEALPKPISARAKAEEEEHHRQAREMKAKYRNTVTAYMQQQKNKIDKVTVIDNRPTTVSNTFSIDGF